MDALIEKKLCAKCRPIVAAALEYDRIQIEAKRARRALQAVLEGHDAEHGDDDADDEPELTRADAIAATKARMGMKPPSPPPPPTERDALGRPVRRVMVSGRNIAMVDVPEDEVVRCIRGDIAPHELAKKLNVSKSVVMKRVQELIGKPDDHTVRWRKSFGFTRNDKRAYDLLMAGKLKHKPVTKPAVGKLSAEDLGPNKQGRKASAQLSSDELEALRTGAQTPAQLATKHDVSVSTIYRYFQMALKIGLVDGPIAAASPLVHKGARAAPVPSDEDLQAIADGHVTRAAIMKKYHISGTHVHRCVQAYARGERYAPAKSEKRVRAERIPELELQRVIDGKRSATQLANKYRTASMHVMACVRELQAKQAGSSDSGDATSNGSAYEPSLAELARIVDDGPDAQA